MKTVIKNSQGEKIVIAIDTPEHVKGIAFIAHGLGGFKEQPHILAFSQALNEKGFLTVRWDARKTIGESEGKLLDATLSNYLEDFNSVVNWASKEKWYKEPFIVCGHSLGAACAVLFTLSHLEKVSGVIAASAFLSGKEFEKSFTPEVLGEWRKFGIREWMSSSQPGVIKRLKWEFMEDAYEYDVLKEIQRLEQPVLFIVGSNDKDTPVELQERAFSIVSSEEKEIYIVQEAEHTFKDASHLSEIKKIIKEWVRKVI